MDFIMASSWVHVMVLCSNHSHPLCPLPLDGSILLPNAHPFRLKQSLWNPTSSLHAIATVNSQNITSLSTVVGLTDERREL